MAKLHFPMIHSAYFRIEGVAKEELERFRETHDSLHEKIEPHITVVFPTSKTELESFVSAIEKCQLELPFEIELEQEIHYDGNVGYLPVKRGKQNIERVFNELNVALGITSNIEFVPHLTVARESIVKPRSIDLNNPIFQITSLIVEKIGNNGFSEAIYQTSM